MIDIDIIHRIAKMFPGLSADLRSAHMKERPEEYIKTVFAGSLMFAIGITVFMFFMISMIKSLSLLLLFIIFPISFLGLFMLMIQRPKVNIQKRRRELDKEVLFAGRFLLIKIRSGVPLLNCLIQGSESYGVASKYFREIVDDINMGTEIEDALENAMKYTPSPHFRKILFQINNALKIGVDVSGPLKNALDEISKYEMNQIKRYGKKLNSMAIFYMLLAVVMPSLGVVMLVVIGSMTGILNEETMGAVFQGMIVALIMIQLMFVMIFKTSRVTVNV